MKKKIGEQIAILLMMNEFDNLVRFDHIIKLP